MIKINLIGHNQHRLRARRRTLIAFCLVMGGVLLASSLTAVLLTRSLQQLQEASAASLNQSREVQALRRKIGELERQHKTSAPQLSALRSAANQQDISQRVLAALRESIPEEAWLTQVRYVEGQVEIVGIVPLESVGTQFVQQLRLHGVFSEATLAKIKRREENGGSSQDFVIKATVAGDAKLGGASPHGGRK
jgi:Tfp pilus assembly protein PilN